MRGIVCIAALLIVPLAGFLPAWGVEEDEPVTIKARINTTRFAPEDPDYTLHSQAIRDGRDEVKGYRLTKFDNGLYGIRKLGGTMGLLYYQGKLVQIQYRCTPQNPAGYTYLYPSGKLNAYSICRPDGSIEIHTPNGAVSGIWRGDSCATATGQSCGSRSWHDVP